MEYRGPDAIERNGISWTITNQADFAAFAVVEEPYKMAGGDQVVVALSKKEASIFSKQVIVFIVDDKFDNTRSNITTRHL